MKKLNKLTITTLKDYRCRVTEKIASGRVDFWLIFYTKKKNSYEEKCSDTFFKANERFCEQVTDAELLNVRFFQPFSKRPFFPYFLGNRSLYVRNATTF